MPGLSVPRAPPTGPRGSPTFMSALISSKCTFEQCKAMDVCRPQSGVLGFAEFIDSFGIATVVMFRECDASKAPMTGGKGRSLQLPCLAHCMHDPRGALAYGWAWCGNIEHRIEQAGAARHPESSVVWTRCVKLAVTGTICDLTIVERCHARTSAATFECSC